METPEDAIDCFLSTGMGYLVLHDILITKKRLHRVFAPLLKAYSDVSALVRVALTAEMRTLL